MPKPSIETILSKILAGPRWRLSPWWPSDSWSSKQNSLLRLLSVAHDQRLDLVPLVGNLAEEHRGRYRKRVRQLARRLAEGTPLVDALEQTPDALSDAQVLSLRFANQTGILKETYQRLAEDNNDASRRTQSSLRQLLVYSIGMTLILGLVLSFLMVCVTPIFEEMHEEYGLSLPLAFQWMAALSRHVASLWPLWILLALAVAWLCWSLPSRRFFRRTSLGSWVRGSQTRSAEFLRLMAGVVEAGRPIPSALSTLARHHFDRNFRQRLMFARIESEHRSDVWNILAEADLLTSTETTVLANASSNQSRAWMMRRLADCKDERVSQRGEVIALLVRPLVVLCFAGIVLFVCIAWFGVLSRLVTSLA